MQFDLSRDFQFGPGTATVYTRAGSNTTSLRAEACTSSPPVNATRPAIASCRDDRTSHGRFTVPTISFRILYVFVVLAHERRRVVYFNVTAHPTAFWTGQQMIEAFPEETAPRYLLRDRDGNYGDEFRDRVEGMGVKEVLTAPRSPWQNAFAERLIGSIRRECLDHVIVFNERSLKRILRSYIDYYHDYRTHLSLRKDTPATRQVQQPEIDRVIELPVVGGLHHRYLRKAA